MKRFLHVFAAALALAAVSCNMAPVSAPTCRRYEALALGPETNFHGSIPDGQFPLLKDPGERIDLAVTLVPPVVGPVTLVQLVDGKPFAKWDLTLPAPTGMSTRCSIGLSVGTSSCGVTIMDQPHPPGGYYELQTRGNTILEAGLALNLCD
ncbi:MAG TPA: hypothetical protein VN634_12375 [Candidatus Limnocylindrales bacterium]|nr:hypothetical protein [Candidatus Limnocylindrales bacterium]